MLRLMAWLCLYNDDYRRLTDGDRNRAKSRVCNKLIKRMKGLFVDKLGVTFDSKETVLNLNGWNIEAYPSNHMMHSVH